MAVVWSVFYSYSVYTSLPTQMILSINHQICLFCTGEEYVGERRKFCEDDVLSNGGYDLDPEWEGRLSAFLCNGKLVFIKITCVLFLTFTNVNTIVSFYFFTACYV
jgi:hypothetical protein